MAEAAIAGARLILDDIQGFLKDKAITDYGANKFITVNAEIRTSINLIELADDYMKTKPNAYSAQMVCSKIQEVEGALLNVQTYLADIKAAHDPAPLDASKRQRILTKVQHAKEHIARAVTLKPAMDITALGELTDILKEKNDALDTTLKERSPVTAEIAAKQTKIYEELAKEGQI